MQVISTAYKGGKCSANRNGDQQANAKATFGGSGQVSNRRNGSCCFVGDIYSAPCAGCWAKATGGDSQGQFGPARRTATGRFAPQRQRTFNRDRRVQFSAGPTTTRQTTAEPAAAEARRPGCSNAAWSAIPGGPWPKPATDQRR